jgi:hypothetical protein
MFLLLFIGVALSLLGCATDGGADSAARSAERVYTSHRKYPSWISDIPEDKKYLYYVGSSSDAGSFDAGKNEAIGDALSQVVATIGIKATSTAIYEERYFAEEYVSTIEAELQTEGRAKLQDAQVTDVYYEQWSRPDGSPYFRVWLLLKYAKADIEREQKRLAELMQLKYGEVLAFEERAALYASQEQLIDAVSAHLGASIAALKIDDGDVYFDRNMLRATELILKIRARKSGEDQLGWVGEPLERPLGLQLYYLEGDREIPIPNVPVRFSYRIPKARSAGYKWLVSSSVSDVEGVVRYDVSMVYEVNDENRVDARIDLSSYLGQLRNVAPDYRESVESFEDVLASKKSIFLFPSDTGAREIRTAVYFLQYDENDALLGKPVTAPVFYEVLFEKRFDIRVIELDPNSLDGLGAEQIWDVLNASSPRGSERIIFGTARILDYDTVSGYDMVRVTAEASLLDRESNQVIRTWQMQRSGTGKSREVAQLNAFSQVGSSLAKIVANTMP